MFQTTPTNRGTPTPHPTWPRRRHSPTRAQTPTPTHTHTDTSCYPDTPAVVAMRARSATPGLPLAAVAAVVTLAALAAVRPTSAASCACLNGGYCNKDTMSCVCPSSCVHGTQSNNCGCWCSSGWGGTRCAECRYPPTCHNDGVANTATGCRCSCPRSCNNGRRRSDCKCDCDRHWGGALCTTCQLSPSFCINDGVLDTGRCACNCPAGCAHGGRRYDDCSCSCTGGWGGPLCQTCQRSNASFPCTNAGVFVRQLCRCGCNLSNDTLPCLHGGTFTDTCACSCPRPWTGPQCDVCPLNATRDCQGGTVAASCACNCTNLPQCAISGQRRSVTTCVCSGATALHTCTVAVMALVGTVGWFAWWA